MGTTEDEEFWGHDVKKSNESLGEPARKTSVDKTPVKHEQPISNGVPATDSGILASRRGSVKTLKSVKSVKQTTVIEDSTMSKRHDPEIVSLKQSVVTEPHHNNEQPLPEHIEEVKKVDEAEETAELEPGNKTSRTLSPVSDVSLGMDKGDLYDSRASLISDTENYYKEDEFELDEPLDSQYLKDDTNVSDVEEPVSNFDQSTATRYEDPKSDADIIALVPVAEEPKKKVKKKKKDDKKKETDKKESSHGVLGMLASHPTVLAGAIVQAPPEKLKGKLKKKTTPSTIDSSKSSPTKKKLSTFTDSTKSPRTITKSSRSRNSLDEISFLRKQLNEVVKENRTLRQIQRRQDAALARLEGNNSDMPNMVNRYNEEVRILKEQLRSQKEKHRERERILKQRSVQMEKLRDKAKKMEKMLTDKGITVNKRDEKNNEQLEELLDDKEKRIKELERQSELLSKNFKHQFNIEVLRHKETQRKLNEYASEYQRLTGRDINLTNNNFNGTQFSQRSPHRNFNEPSQRKLAEYQFENKVSRTVNADVQVNAHNSQIPRRNLSKSRKVNDLSPKRSPQRRMNGVTSSSSRKLPLASTKTQSADDEHNISISPKLTLFADYQRSLSSTPKKSDTQGTASKGNDRISSPYNDDLIRASEQQPSRKDSPLVSATNSRQNSAPKPSLLSQADAEDSLLDFTKKPLGANTNAKPLVGDDPFIEIKKNAPSSAVRPSPSNVMNDLFGNQNDVKTNKVIDKGVGENSTRNSADSGLATSTDGSPQQQNQPKSDGIGRRKNVFDLDDEDLFPLAKAKTGAKMTNGLFPWEQDALAKTKS